MFFFYKFITFCLYPFFIIFIYVRKLNQKEDEVRYKEKIFSKFFRINRNYKKKLIWLHAASIGEVQSIFPVIEKLKDTDKNLEFLITTITLSSGKLVESKYKLDNYVSHRYFPLDVKFLIKIFLDKWKPNLVLFVDSEIWPNLIFEIKKKKIPSVLINGRITNKSFSRWSLIPRFAKKIFNTFDLCLPSSQTSKNYLDQLNAKNIKFIGNIKLAGKINIDKFKNKNENFFNKNRIWGAVSTHKGEEIFCLKTHKLLKKEFNNIKTIIIPRHINRSNEIKLLCDDHNFISQILNKNEIIEDKTQVVIVNSFGVIHEFLKYFNSVFMGKSVLQNLKNESGQNPIEAAKLGCKVYHGPFVVNFKEIYTLLNSYKITEEIKNEKELSEKLSKDFKNIISNNNQTNKKINDLGKEILDNSIKEIKNFL